MLAENEKNIILEGLARAAVAIDGLPLHHPSRGKGVFTNSASSKRAAVHCMKQEYLKVLRTERQGRQQREYCGITDRGVRALLEMDGKSSLVREVVSGIDQYARPLCNVLDLAQRVDDGQNGTLCSVEGSLNRLWSLLNGRMAAPGINGIHATSKVPNEMGRVLSDWNRAGSQGDCPLPEFYRALRELDSGLTTGRFHDALRQAVDRGLLFLYPWTGPLSEIPEPEYALLIGHTVAYYVNKKE